MIRAAIIDPEASGRSRLKELLKIHCPQVELLGEADDIDSGYKLIVEKRPQLVFLDIKMPNGNGFDILNQCLEMDFQVIFVTAYDQYAIRAIKFSALDYLLKPLEKEELIEAVSKVGKPGKNDKKVKSLISNLSSTAGLRKLAIPSNSNILYIRTDNILYCEAAGNYTYFYLKDGSKIVSSKLLKEYEELLVSCHFFRVHRSYLVNLRYVCAFKKNGTEVVEMEGGARVEVSRKKKAEFLRAMESII